MNKHSAGVLARSESEKYGQVHYSSNPEIRYDTLDQQDPAHHEIDHYTGLPKLPIELPPKESSLKPLIRMSNDSNRKSVTFDPSTKKVEQKEGIKLREKIKTSPAIRKTMSAPLGITQHQLVKGSSSPATSRHSGRPASLTYGRSKSVFLRLQLPNSTSPAASYFRKSPTIFGGEPEASEDEMLQKLEDTHGVLESESSPIMSRSGPLSMDRRPSFLYSGQDSALSDVSSLSIYPPKDTYVTPFAQILSTLHRVRGEYLQLMGLPIDTKTDHTRPGWTPVPSPNLSSSRKLSDNSEKKLSLEVLSELDWCMKQLESIDSAKSVGDMAHEKFRRLLNKELSHMSVGSKKGAQVAEWVTNITNLDEYDVDKALGLMYKEHENEELDSTLSASFSHETWSRTRAQKGERRRLSDVESNKCSSTSLEKDYCERLPVYGIHCEGMDMEAMKDFMENKLDTWNLDVFYFNTISCDNPLISVSYTIFKKRKFFSQFQMEPHVFINYISAIQNMYHPKNPYHNAIHATDVFISTNHLLNFSSLEDIFTPLEQLAALVAAAVHDVDHPGMTNQFLVTVRHELAILYNDTAVLENHHVATAFKILQKTDCNFLENCDHDQVQAFRKMVIDMVLATDMSQHMKNLAEMKTLLETKKVANDGILVLDKYSDRSVVLKCLVHCADLSNPVKNEELAASWAQRILDENFIQGDKEKELGITIHALGKREISIIQSQTSFIDYIIFPLWETWGDLVYPCAQHLLENIHRIRDYWNDKTEPSSPPPPNRDKEEDSTTMGTTTAEQNSLMCSLDSAILKDDSSASPACDRRLSFKTGKSKAMCQDPPLLQVTGEPSDK